VGRSTVSLNTVAVGQRSALGVGGSGLGVVELVALPFGFDDPATVGEPVERSANESIGSRPSVDDSTAGWSWRSSNASPWMAFA
jgi:hypothetical protein